MSEPSPSPRVEQLHRGVALALTMTAIAFAGPAAHLSLEAQALLLAGGVLVSGLPHGAVDHLRARPVLHDRFGRAWLPVFGVAYLGLALAAAGLWWLWPTPSLLVFLLLSSHHFGAGDARGALGIVAHGSAPLLAPCVAHPDATAGLFALLTGGETVAWQELLRAAQPWLAGLGGALLAALVAKRRRFDGAVAELLAIATAGLLLPPLLSFALYFCVWHAPRHVLHVARELWPGPVPIAVARFARAALAATIAAVVGGVLVAVALPGAPEPLRRGLQLVFVGLAALTVPHLLVTERLRRWPAPLPVAMT